MDPRYARACLIALVSMIGMLAAGTGGPRRVGATTPTVTYSYRNDAELREAQDQASEWCADRYSVAARPADRWPANGEATFVCVPD